MKSIFPIIFIALSVVCFIFFVNPVYKDVNKLRADVATYDKALEHSKNLQKTRDDLLVAYNEISESDKERLIRFLPNSVDNIRFILEIQQLASMYGIGITDIAFTPPVTSTDPNSIIDPLAKPYGAFELEFKTDARYETFLSFLKSIEENLRLINIKSIVFEVPKAKGGDIIDPNLYKYTVKVETYWLKN